MEIPGTSDRVALERKRGNTGFSCPHLQDRFLSAGAQAGGQPCSLGSQSKEKTIWVECAPLTHPPQHRLLSVPGGDRFSDTQASLGHIQRARRKEGKACKQPSNICFSSRFQSMNLLSLIGSIQWCVTSSQSDNRGGTSLTGRRCFLWVGGGEASACRVSCQAEVQTKDGHRAKTQGASRNLMP